jgi:vacuolar-type H+-ATPase subunit C/Vma6
MPHISRVAESSYILLERVSEEWEVCEVKTVKRSTFLGHENPPLQNTILRYSENTTTKYLRKQNCLVVTP